MARRIQYVEPQPLNLDPVAFGDSHRDDVGMSLFAHYGDAMGTVAKCAEPGNVVGVQMGVDGFDQLQVELANELQVAVHLFQDRIDDQCFAAGSAGEKVRVGPGSAVEELAKKHA